MTTLTRHICSALALALLLSLGLAAGANAQDVRPFDEVQATPITVTPDPSGRSAVLEVETSIDMACSVVYGPDDSFGQIAVDSDMQGGAHRDHQPLLAGLEPDTEYRYRVQGTAPDGTLYMSEVFSFRTPAAPTGGPPNLALEGSVSGVSSEFSEVFQAERAFDGDLNTAWSSAGDGDDAWIELDLGSARWISEISYRSRSMGDGSSVTETYSVTADGESIGTFQAEQTVPLELEAQVLRFDVETSTGGNTGALEIVVLGEE